MRILIFSTIILCLVLIGCSDTEAPYVSIINPVHGSLVNGTVTVSALATDNKGIDKVDFFIDDTLVSTAEVEPYRYLWDTSSLMDSTYHSIYAQAFDAAGNSDVSATITVCIGSC